MKERLPEQSARNPEADRSSLAPLKEHHKNWRERERRIYRREDGVRIIQVSRYPLIGSDFIMLDKPPQKLPKLESKTKITLSFGKYIKRFLNL